MALKAGVVGLGTIGGGVAICLARAGLLEAVYDIRPNAAEKLEDVRPVVGSPAELARRCDIALIAVVDAAQVREVLTGPHGLLAGKTHGLTVGLLSTVSLSDLRELRRIAIDGGAKFIDSGVTGGTVAAERGLVCLVGAEPGDLETVLSVYEAFAWPRQRASMSASSPMRSR
jgi:3-hydroxyisobutyrate dehydrogenase